LTLSAPEWWNNGSFILRNDEHSLWESACPGVVEKLLKLRLEEGAQVELEITVRKVGRTKNLKAIAERKAKQRGAPAMRRT